MVEIIPLKTQTILSHCYPKENSQKNWRKQEEQKVNEPTQIIRIEVVSLDKPGLSWSDLSLNPTFLPSWTLSSNFFLSHPPPPSSLYNPFYLHGSCWWLHNFGQILSLSHFCCCCAITSSGLETIDTGVVKGLGCAPVPPAISAFK